MTTRTTTTSIIHLTAKEEFLIQFVKKKMAKDGKLSYVCGNENTRMIKLNLLELRELSSGIRNEKRQLT
jgi:hypothetical protein